MKNFLRVLIPLFLIQFQLYATHNRAGEITYCRDASNPLKYNFTVVTYTKVDPSVIADRPDLFLFFGNLNDGNCTAFDSIPVPRINGPVGGSSEFFPPGTIHRGEMITPSIKKNIYTGAFTFAGPGNYCIGMNDPNRNADVVNIPNSVEIVFNLQSTLTISPFLGGNCSPVLLNPPIDDACFCKRFIHNPGAYDPDGDSLSYELVQSRGNFGAPIYCFFTPSGANINSINGDLIWTCPGANTINCEGQNVGGLGEYNMAILITEWRNGIKIGTVLRDMQINVIGGCQNDPPVITARDTCVIAGEPLVMDITATDPNLNTITLTSTGEPYLLPSGNNATFTQTGSFAGLAEGRFEWNTNCSNIKVNPYSVSFKATDNASNPLVDYKTINIKVIAPAPTLLSATPQGTTINLTWQASNCPNVSSYKIFRRISPSGFQPDECETGLPGSAGFVQIATINGNATFNYTDNNNGSGLLHGYEYCYRIYGTYENGAESIVSNELCARLKRDVPIITKVSVGRTSSTNGIDTIQWKKPTEIDSILWPPPYTYKIYRKQESNGTESEIVTLNNLDLTSYLDSNINTEQFQYFYRIEVFSGATKIGSSNTASSPFLTSVPNDNTITLNVSFTVPWTNYKYLIYKEDVLNPGNFLFLDTAISTSYTDSGLLNGKQYCYYIVTMGEYGDTGFVRPLKNWSQIKCDIPVDLTPPCPPDLTVDADCENINNTVTIRNTNRACSDDIVKYDLWFSPVKDTPLELIKTLIDRNDTIVFHNIDNYSIAGCYAVTATDTVGNVSIFSDTICVDNCPIYELPNVYTPNDDGSNDLFIPFPYKFVKDIDLVIFDRWGTTVFKTNNRDILWNGVNATSGMPCDDGVYFYICNVNEIRLSGIETRLLKGFVHIYGNKDAKKN